MLAISESEKAKMAAAVALRRREATKSVAEDQSIMRDDFSRAKRAKALADELVKVGKQDRTSFEEVYRLTSHHLFGLCLYILPTREDAEDVLQDVYDAVWRKAVSFDPNRATAMTWLITLTRNRAIDRLRRIGAVPTSPIEYNISLSDESPSADKLMEVAEEERQLVNCMNKLQNRDADLIRAAFFQGSTYPELAVRASTPLATIKSRIRRALITLRACLEELI